MVITLDELVKQFTELLSEEKYREEIADWAIHLQELYDKNDLFFKPINDEKRIWEGIQFLAGIDLQYKPNYYLHSKSDIQKFILNNFQKT